MQGGQAHLGRAVGAAGEQQPVRVRRALRRRRPQPHRHVRAVSVARRGVRPQRCHRRRADEHRLVGHALRDARPVRAEHHLLAAAVTTAQQHGVRSKVVL